MRRARPAQRASQQRPSGPCETSGQRVINTRSGGSSSPPRDPTGWRNAPASAASPRGQLPEDVGLLLAQRPAVLVRPEGLDATRDGTEHGQDVMLRARRRGDHPGLLGVRDAGGPAGIRADRGCRSCRIGRRPVLRPPIEPTGGAPGRRGWPRGPSRPAVRAPGRSGHPMCSSGRTTAGWPRAGRFSGGSWPSRRRARRPRG
jgi:hypothetical protein